MKHPTGVLLVNLGTPDAPTAGAVRRYLAEFLTDRRVVDSPRWWWLPLLHGLILPLRSPASARRYASIWGPAGSPLAVTTAEQASGLQARLGPGYEVVWAMRYGRPSVSGACEDLRRKGCRRWVVLPLFPQVSATTVGSVFDAVARALARHRFVPELTLVAGFHEQLAYQSALAASVRDLDPSGCEHLLISFHGLPEAFVREGDRYQDDCEATAKQLVASLGLKVGQWSLAYQSRFGRGRWLGPSTVEHVADLARSGVRRLDVVCPSFVADCLETLEEINGEVRQAFLNAGGQELRLVPALGTRPLFLDALAELVRERS